MSAEEPADEEPDAGAETPESGDTDVAEAAGDPTHATDRESAFATDRTTAPQSPYTGRDVAVGALVAAVGIALTVVVPFLLA